MLWRFDASQSLNASVDHDLRHGLFTVRSGKTSFLAHAWTQREQLRYDPGCMEPADGRALRVAHFLDSRLESAIAFTWSEPGQVLAIDNRRVLHARSDATNEPDRTIERLSLVVNEWPASSTPPRKRIPRS